MPPAYPCQHAYTARVQALNAPSTREQPPLASNRLFQIPKRCRMRDCRELTRETREILTVSGSGVAPPSSPGAAPALSMLRTTLSPSSIPARRAALPLLVPTPAARGCCSYFRQPLFFAPAGASPAGNRDCGR